MSNFEGNLLTFVVLALIVVFACVTLSCMMDWTDYRAEFPNGDPNVGAELTTDVWAAECTSQ